MTDKKALGPDAPDQLTFGFPETIKSFDELEVSEANEAALQIVKSPENWPTPLLCLLGPPKSGLTTIAKAWAAQFGDGEIMSARKLGKAKAPALDALADSYTALDQTDRLASNDNLVSLMNLVSGGTGRLLLTANTPPSQWATDSADLRSRLNALPVAEIFSPDEALLVARLQAAASKHFLKLDSDTVKFLVPRLDLTYEAVEMFVEELSKAVTKTGKAPRAHLAGEVLEMLGWTNSDQPDLI